MQKQMALSMMLLLFATVVVAQEAKQPARKTAVPPSSPTYADVKYGPYARNLLDVWLAKSDKPTPVLVSIHGGGFHHGKKVAIGALRNPCLSSGISVVAITYRFSDEAIAPASFLDSARAIQFIRSQAKEWNLDASRIVATGSSAGAGISLWLGFHDDLADPHNPDPVLRQSTRLTCVAVSNGQTSYDPRFLRKLFPDADTYKHPALAELFAADLDKLDALPQEKYKLFEECSALPHLTKDDPPVLLLYTSDTDDTGIHSARFGQVLKEKMDALGIECQVHTKVKPGSEQWAKLMMDFVKRHLAMK